jgi:hypothetical protein
VDKLVARLLAMAALWVQSRHLSKIQMGDISKGVANMHYSPLKNIQKNILPDIWEDGKNRLSIINLFKECDSCQRHLECRQRINCDVYIDHVVCNFPWLDHKPPTLYRYWEKNFDFKWQKQSLLRSFRSLSEWGLHRFFWKFQLEELKARPSEWYQIKPTSFLIGQYL